MKVLRRWKRTHSREEVESKADTLLIWNEAQTNVLERLESSLVLLEDRFAHAAVFQSNKGRPT
jgi:hypothetical protein